MFGVLCVLFVCFDVSFRTPSGSAESGSHLFGSIDWRHVAFEWLGADLVVGFFSASSLCQHSKNTLANIKACMFIDFL